MVRIAVTISFCKLRYKLERESRIFRTPFVIPLGLEPKTHSLEGCCSIQLSYGTDTRTAAATVKRCKINN